MDNGPNPAHFWLAYSALRRSVLRFVVFCNIPRPPSSAPRARPCKFRLRDVSVMPCHLRTIISRPIYGQSQYYDCAACAPVTVNANLDGFQALQLPENESHRMGSRISNPS